MTKTLLPKRRVSDTPVGFSLFEIHDLIQTERMHPARVFESPRVTINEIGQICLNFYQYEKKYHKQLYTNEYALAIDQFGKCIIGDAIDIAELGLFEVMVTLRTERKNEEDEYLLSMWMRNRKPLLATHIDHQPDTHFFASVFFGGFGWFLPEVQDSGKLRLFLPKDIQMLSELCIRLETVPRHFLRKQNEEQLYY
jgi:hypothetical protein